MTTDPAALALPPREPEAPADLVWTPGHVTYSTSVPDKHDESEARADR